MRFEVDWVRAGQRRAYEDTVHEATIRVFENGEQRTFNDDYIKNLAKTLVHPWTDDFKGENWHRPRITKFTSRGNEWDIQITTPFTD